MLQEDCNRLDPRIRRTRQLLQDALRKLLDQKGFDDITVQDITEAATLNRATFYAHYPDKFALLEEPHHVLFQIVFELAVQQSNLEVWKYAVGELFVHLDGGLHLAFFIFISSFND